MTQRLLLALISLLILFISCDDECTPSDIENTDAQVSITGTVISAYDQKPVKNVRLRILDLLGGTALLRYDTSYYSNSDGCFKIEFDRDLREVDMYIEDSPNLSYDFLHQSLRAWDDSYYHLYNNIEGMRLLSFMRWRYNPLVPIEVVVVPRADINIKVVDNTFDDLSFSWNFTDTNLSDIGPRYFSIDNESVIWTIPAEKEIVVSVVDNTVDREMIWDTTFTAQWRSFNELSVQL